MKLYLIELDEISDDPQKLNVERALPYFHHD